LSFGIHFFHIQFTKLTKKQKKNTTTNTINVVQQVSLNEFSVQAAVLCFNNYIEGMSFRCTNRG